MSVAGNVVAANAFSMRGSHRKALQPLAALAFLRAGDLFDPFTLSYINPGGSAGVQPAWCFHAFAVILHARIDREGAAKPWYPADPALSPRPNAGNNPRKRSSRDTIVAQILYNYG